MLLRYICENFKKLREVSNGMVKFWIEDGILFNKVIKKGILLDIPMCKEIVELRHKISDGKPQYFLYDMENLNDFTTESKNYFAIYGQNYIQSAAVLVYSSFQKFSINLWIKIKKPKVPMRVFTSKEQALHWLKTQKMKNERETH